MLDSRNKFEAYCRHYRRIRRQSADVKRDLDEAYCHQDRRPEKCHPACKLLCSTRQVNQCKSEDNDENWTHRLHPGSPHYFCVVLLCEIGQLRPCSARWRAIVDSE